MTEKTIDDVFKLLDDWRHLPKYQLERRADIYFALFLPDVLERHYEKHNIKLDRKIIPEFPLRLGTLWPNAEYKRPNQSVNVDYVAFSKCRQKVLFVELKTDLGSRNPEQDDNLKQAKDLEFRMFVDGLLTISKPDVTGEARKYIELLKLLSGLDLVDDIESVCRIASNKTLHGLPAALDKVKINVPEVGLQPKIVYIQPRYDQATHKDYADYIYLEEFAHAIKGRGAIANRFALSLLEWAGADADSTQSDAKCP